MGSSGAHGSSGTGAYGVSSVAIADGAGAYSDYSIALGLGAITESPGQVSICVFPGWTNNPEVLPSYFGQVQSSFISLGNLTTDNTPTLLFSTNSRNSSLSTGNILLANNATYGFSMDIVAQTTGGGADSAMWSIKFLMQKSASAASTTLIGTPSGTGSPLFSTAGASTWSVSITADTTNGVPAITVTGQVGVNITWFCNAQITKTGY